MKKQQLRKPVTYAFIDASNLFYGGEKSLGWKIDYHKLFKYLKSRYGCRRVFYFGGIETHGYKHNYRGNDTVPLPELLKYLRQLYRKVPKKGKGNKKAVIIDRHIQRVKFYKKLQDFGYYLVLKPVKEYRNTDGSRRRKANSDLDMTLHMFKDLNKYDEALVLSGDGDFLPVLKFLKHNKKKATILARGPRTAREIKQFAGSNFRDFGTLRAIIER